jgi:hypothetical protein
MSSESKFGPPLSIDTAAERQQLVEADEAFTKRLAAALQRGDETAKGLLTTVGEPKHFQPWRFTRGLP